MYSLLIIVLSSIVVYLSIITAIRVFGKREISQLSVIDLVFILLISNAVQNAMVGGSIELLIAGLVAAGTLFVANYFLGELFYRSKRFSKLVQGEPLMLIYKGKINEAHLKNAKISNDELEEAIREHGVAHIEDVDLAVLERDGNISVLSDDFHYRVHDKEKTKDVIKKEEIRTNTQA